MVDWDLAVSTATRLISPGPEVSRSEADAAVRSLREQVEVAAAHVERITALHPTGPIPPTRVVDRPGWVRTNADGMSRLLTPLVETLEERRPRPAGRFEQTVGPKATGLQAGGVLAFLSSKVLGQLEFFADPGGQLLLVAPNVVEAERSLAVSPVDFRLWVALHEVTHRVQFTAVPWLRGHLTSEIDALVDDMIQTMYAAPGIGLAAPQVGIAKRVFVCDISVGRNPNDILIFINPEFVERDGMQLEEEGCLSVPGFNATVARPARAVLKGLDRHGEPQTVDASGLLARCFQHEMDHLDGTLFVDRLRGLQKDLIVRKIKKLAKAGKW